VGTTRTLALALLLAAGAVLVGGTASAVDSQNPSEHFLGALAAQGARAQGADPNSAPGPNLTWHGGPVMHSNTVYSIYWAPAGYSYQTGYSASIDSYFKNVAADSGRKTNVYAVDTQYADASGPAGLPD
jgi:hypothetical protein